MNERERMSPNRFRPLYAGILFLLSASAPASAQENYYLPCTQGPQALREIDALERRGGTPDLREGGWPISPEALAERFIGDCSEKLAILSFALERNPDSPLRALMGPSLAGLDFMKWWLVNRREKSQTPSPRRKP